MNIAFLFGLVAVYKFRKSVTKGGKSLEQTRRLCYTENTERMGGVPRVRLGADDARGAGHQGQALARLLQAMQT